MVDGGFIAFVLMALLWGTSDVGPLFPLFMGIIGVVVLGLYALVGKLSKWVKDGDSK
jgi:hypothetical protein